MLIRLIKGSIVEIMPGNEIYFIEPWYKLEKDNSHFEQELHHEIAEGHVLFGKNIQAVGRRQDNDDVLFQITDDTNEFAVVHLTWSRQKEKDPRFPITRLFQNWLDVYNNCMVPDHNLFNSRVK